jgi:MinD-like ATPase involved in chromosome partitioning or flagellar assembly
MYTITFYSFKGGVGRTMALVNVAAELARMGRKVLVVDFDLEAPGLETFEHLRPSQPHPGLVEYVTEYMRSRCSPDVRDYIYSADKIGKKDGQLWVMPAGRRDRDYHLALSRLDWRKLYEDCEGFLFFEDLKAQWEQEYKPDYVLIDSRTGHSDVKGICTRQLPDAVVMLFIPNEQNLIGLRAVCREIQNERNQGLEKDIRIHLVPSNVPDLDDEDGLLRRQLKAFTDELQMHRPIPRLRPLVIHRHESLGMLEQPVFVLQRPRSRLAREYRRLTRSLIMENPVDPEGALLFLQGMERDREIRRMQRSGFGLVEDRLSQIASQFADNPKILHRLAWFYQARGEMDVALQQLDSALQVRPNWPVARYERGRWRRQVKDKAGAAEDLLQFLQTPNYFPSDWGQEDPCKKRRLANAETALRELIDVSFEAYLRGLASSGVQAICFPHLPGVLYSSRFFDIWLNSAAEHLLRERRWKEAIQYLETVVPEWIGRCTPTFSQDMLLICQGEREWYLAMAYWGDSGNLRSDLCSQAQKYLLEAVGHYKKIGLENCQRLALLHWAIGESDQAFHFLDRALGEHRSFGWNPGVSQWTFQPASVHEFRQHCEEMRRMIQGEPIRPAFLGPTLASHTAGVISPSGSLLE